MVGSRIGISLSVVTVAFMIFLYAAFSKYPSTVCSEKSFISRNEEGFQGGKISHIAKTTEKLLTRKIKELSKDLTEMQRSLVSSASSYNKLGLHIQKCFEMLKILNQNISEENMLEDSQKESITQNAKKEVCPEKFMGKLLNYGYPLFRKGFERVDCKEFVPIEKLVTIIAILPKELGKPAQSYLEILQGVAKYYSGMRVILATQKDIGPPVKSEISKLNIGFENHIINDAGQGALLMELVSKVSTPYMLIASNITHFDEDINLERMVRVLSYEPRVAFVGGAHRNLRGEWDIGCQQVAFKNMTARYMGGYYRSFNECVVCDYLSGSIMARSETFKELQFDASVKYGAFHDLFWRFKNEMPENIAASCPDVMFNIHSREIDDVELVTFANKHLIHRIIDPDGRVRWYGCRKGYSYTSAGLCKKGKGMGLSPADMENLADVIKFFMRACHDAGAFCEFQSGTMMGAVKFNGVLPWDIDGDIVFLAKNFSVIEKLKDKIQKAGYSLSLGYRPAVKKGRLTGGYFGLKTTNWKVDLWGFAEFGSQMDVARGIVPTKVMFSGQWVNHPHNPGLFARNRYGTGIYKHQEHWRRHKHGSAWILYNPGSFIECPEPGHSSCLDQYPADGNMQFRDYCPS